MYGLYASGTAIHSYKCMICRFSHCDYPVPRPSHRLPPCEMIFVRTRRPERAIGGWASTLSSLTTTHEIKLGQVIPCKESITMPLLSFCLTELPAETLEQTFLCLPGQEIIKMEAVRNASVTSIHFPTDFSAAWPRSVDNSRT